MPILLRIPMLLWLLPLSALAQDKPGIFVQLGNLRIFRQFLLLIVVTSFSFLQLGCAGVVAVAQQAETAEKLEPFVEIVDVNINEGISFSTMQDARILSAVLREDMKTAISVPDPRDKEVNDAATEEIRRHFNSHNTARNTIASEVLRVETYYTEGRFPLPMGHYHFFKVSKEKEKKVSWMFGVVPKLIDVRLTMWREGAMLMEARGLWVGGYEADHIAGSQWLAREVSRQVSDKIKVSSPLGVSVMETGKQ